MALPSTVGPFEIEEARERPLLPDGSVRPPGWGSDGVSMHTRGSGIPPERWSVTREDLARMRRIIKTEVAAGRITPSHLDPFDLQDDEVGPNMYTVVEQYIKPLTLQAGGMSYALLQHPAGLQCDFLVTHAWVEGAYELIDQVLDSWPRGKTAAWICCFAIPQNLLHMTSLIGEEPRESPFALALRVASHVLVVPNKQCSVYTRIWCVYEAYLGMHWDKTVLTARPSILKAALRSTLIIFGWFTVAVALVALVRIDNIPEFILDDIELYVFLTMFLGLILMMAVACGRNIKVNHVVFRFMIVPVVGACALLTDHTITAKPPADFGENFGLVLLLLVLVLILLVEVDFLSRTVSKHQQMLLSSGYTCVEQATSTRGSDKLGIMADIGEELAEVNGAVEVLQQVGMSTAGLRKARALGISPVPFRGVIWSLYGFFLLWFVWLVDFSRFWWLSEFSKLLTTSITLMSWACFLYFFARLAVWRLEEDDEAFMMMTLVKFMFMCICPPIGLIVYLSFFFPDEMPLPEEEVATMVKSVTFIMNLLSLLCARGRLGMLELPLIGPQLARMLEPSSCRGLRVLVGLCLLMLAQAGFYGIFALVD